MNQTEILQPVSKIPSKYQPRGYHIIYEDNHIIAGIKSPGVLTVAAPYEKSRTVHQALNVYVRKGNSRSRKTVFPVHRLDRETSGILIFAKTFEAQTFIKDHWSETEKIYYTIVYGHPAKKTGTIKSHLFEDDKYVVRSFEDGDDPRSKLAVTHYEVVDESRRFSLVRVSLETGRKNQIRVHMADLGHPVVGDAKYGPPESRYLRLALHAFSLTIPHPAMGKRVKFDAPIPDYFYTLMR